MRNKTPETPTVCHTYKETYLIKCSRKNKRRFVGRKRQKEGNELKMCPAQ
jgi:hypothetical protein